MKTNKIINRKTHKKYLARIRKTKRKNSTRASKLHIQDGGMCFRNDKSKLDVSKIPKKNNIDSADITKLEDPNWHTYFKSMQNPPLASSNTTNTMKLSCYPLNATNSIEDELIKSFPDKALTFLSNELIKFYPINTLTMLHNELINIYNALADIRINSLNDQVLNKNIIPFKCKYSNTIIDIFTRIYDIFIINEHKNKIIIDNFTNIYNEKRNKENKKSVVPFYLYTNTIENKTYTDVNTLKKYICNDFIYMYYNNNEPYINGVNEFKPGYT